MGYTIKFNKYIITKYNGYLYILTREGATNSNCFYIRDGAPVFDDSLYVCNTTKRKIKTLIKKGIIQ